MKKLLLIAGFLSAFGVALAAVETKQQKIEQLFELTNTKERFLEILNPTFVSVNITDEAVQNAITDEFLVTLKDEFITLYDKTFTETDIDVMIKYYQSATGKRVLENIVPISTKMQQIFGNIMTIIQKTLAAQNEAAGIVKSPAVMHFNEMAKGKNDTETRELFDKEIRHDGLTIVKFSAVWCGPCKTYAPIFEEVAEQIKEVIIDDKKVSVKYVVIDIDATKIIAQDCAVSSIPATIFYKNGKKVESIIGGITKDVLNERIHELAK